MMRLLLMQFCIKSDTLQKGHKWMLIGTNRIEIPGKLWSQIGDRQPKNALEHCNRK